MSVNADFKDLFRILNTCRVRYLVAGAHAVIYHTEPRYTKDLDIWVESTARNAARVWAALEQFGAPLRGVTVDDFSNPDLVFQIGVQPNRIDVMMSIPGVRFATAWRNRIRSRYGGVRINIMARSDIARAKRAAARPQDMLDLAALKQ